MYQPFFIHSFVNVFVVIAAIWTIPWKVYAIWLSVKNGHKKWFVAMLILNTFAILEIIYVFKIVKKSWEEVKTDFRNAWKNFK